MKKSQVITFRLIFSVLLLMLAASTVANASVQMSAAIGGEIMKQFKTGKLKINKIEVEKPHIFQEEELRQLLSKYEGREITVRELKQVQSTLSKYYFETGYVNSGVIIPDQTIENGVIKFKAIHGRLTRVKITGNKQVSNKYIYGKLRKGLEVPLNALSLQQSLINLRQDPLFADVKAHISPGEELGQSTLQLQVKENSPYYFTAEANNHKSTSIGQYGISLYGGHRNLTGMQDTVQADISFTEGLKDAGLSYLLPMGMDEILLSASVNYSQAEIIDPAFVGADMKSTITGYSLGLKYPVVNTTKVELAGRVALDVREMTFSMLGNEQDLPGVESQSSSPAVFGIDALVQRSRFASALSVGVRRGLNLGLIDEDAEKQVFTAGVGQLYVAFRPVNRVEWVLRLNSQLALDDLPAVEKFAIGGAKSVRGYRENIFVRDSGVTASTHVRFPLYRAKLFMVPFVDYGRSWERSQGTLGKNAEQILSVGTGLQWNISKAFYSELFWGHALMDVDDIDEIQQDNGFHFLLNYKIF